MDAVPERDKTLRGRGPRSSPPCRADLGDTAILRGEDGAEDDESRMPEAQKAQRGDVCCDETEVEALDRPTLPNGDPKQSKVGTWFRPRANEARIPRENNGERERPSGSRSSCVSSHRHRHKGPRGSTTKQHVVRRQYGLPDDACADDILTSETRFLAGAASRKESRTYRMLPQVLYLHRHSHADVLDLVVLLFNAWYGEGVVSSSESARTPI